MRKIIVTILAVLSVILACVFYWLKGQGDYTPPVISFPDHEITFTEGENKENLLKGVTAIDETDGDVSDTLVVESVIPMRDELRATVIYYAKDKSNNVGKATRTVSYLTEETKEWAEVLEEDMADGQKQDETNEKKSENDIDKDKDTGDVIPSEENGGSQAPDTEETPQQGQENTSAPDGKKEEGSTPQDSQDEGTQAGEAQGATPQAGESQSGDSNTEEPQSETPAPQTEEPQEEELPAGSPRVILKTDQVEVARGSKNNFLNYVEEITDDKDDKSWLWHQIYITGLKDIDLDVPGTYELYYTVTDSDRNVSNRAKLTVVVK